MERNSTMEINKALQIIRTLADGIDPYTGEVYPATSPYQNPETVRALLAAMDALESARKRKERKSLLPNRAGEPWDEDETLRLIKKFEMGVPINQLASEHKRTNGAILSRLAKLGRTPQPHPE